MNINHITFDKVVITRLDNDKTETVYNARIRLHPKDDSLTGMGESVIVEGFRRLNVNWPNETLYISFVFRKWEVKQFMPWDMNFSCVGAYEDKLVDVNVDCIFSLPLVDK